MFGWLEFVIIAGAVVLLFGGSRLPGLARGMGKAVKNFKLSLRGDDGIEVRPIPKGDRKKKESDGLPRNNHAGGPLGTPPSSGK